MADIIDNGEYDKDTVSPEELDQLFKGKYTLLTETAVSLKKTFINKLQGTKSLKFAISVSDNSIEVYQLDNASFSRVCRLSGHKKPLTEVVFSPKEDHLLYSAGQDGLLKLWDTRSGGSCVLEFKDEEEQIIRPYECMDITCNGRVLCAGSQLVQDDAYLVFWDQRNTSPLGGYWNSHTDDLTQVKFHKSKNEILTSAALDGLVNVYNIFEQTEDDALTYSINTDTSVEKLSWLDDKHIACVMQSNDLKVCDVENGDIVKCFTQDKVSKSIKRSKEDDCYLVDTYTSNDGSHVLLAGSNAGTGNVLRSVTIADKKLQPHTNFSQNKQTVSCCWYDKDRDILVTTGESGLLSAWREARAALQAPAHRTTSTNKHVRHKPY